MQICSLSSGSSGNCIYVGDESTHLLIDVGISGKKIEQGLYKIGIDPKNLDGILVTHEHSDHIKSLGVMARRYKVPIYSTQNTWNELMTYGSLGAIDNGLHKRVIPDQAFFLKDICIKPFKSFHDAVEPVCYTFSKADKKISVATDIGCYDDYIKEQLKGSNILFIEANHDIKMLEVGSYPYFLKQRILSDIGHLSNEMSGKLISEIIHKDLRYVVLGHLSKENNYPDLAYETVKLELHDSVNLYKSEVVVSVAKRDENSDLLVI